MKTTTKAIATKKLAKLEINKTTVAYKVALDILTGTRNTYLVYGDKIRPVYTSGKGRFCSNQDHTKEIQLLLSTLGIETILTNDSQRGGLTGNLLTITTIFK
jgi:hypothetical protein